MLEKLPESIGQALRDRRAGLDKLVLQNAGLRQGMAQIEVKSLVFQDHMPIPPIYTADGEGISPPLQWSGIPNNATTVLLIVEDADAPTPLPLVHAIAVNLPPGEGDHGEGALPEGALKSPGHPGDDDLKQGRNSYLMTGWLPPDPPPGHGTHRYAFQVFALGEGDPFHGKPGRDDVVRAVQERGLASGCLIGTYMRPDGSVKDSEKVGQGAPVLMPEAAAGTAPSAAPGLAPLA